MRQSSERRGLGGLRKRLENDIFALWNEIFESFGYPKMNLESNVLFMEEWH